MDAPKTESAATPPPEISAAGRDDSCAGSQHRAAIKAARDTALSGMMLCVMVMIVVPSWPTAIGVAAIATMVAVVCLRLLKHE